MSYLQIPDGYIFGPDLRGASLKHPKIDEIQDQVRNEVRSYVTETVNRLGQFDVVGRRIPIIWLNLPVFRWMAHNGVLSGGRTGGCITSAGEQFVTSDHRPMPYANMA